MHRTLDLKVMYFGTPVVLISTRNENGSTNLAPMSSAWWLGDRCLLGLGNAGQTTANLRREREGVLNLVSSAMVDVVDRLALTTGRADVPRRKRAMGYEYVPDKFGHAGVTSAPSHVVAPPRVAECPIQLECRVVAEHAVGEDGGATAFEVAVVRSHVAESLVLPGTEYVDPVAWDPLIMKFCEFFGGGEAIHPSRLAEGWEMPHRLGGLERATA